MDENDNIIEVIFVDMRYWRSPNYLLPYYYDIDEDMEKKLSQPPEFLILDLDLKPISDPIIIDALKTKYKQKKYGIWIEKEKTEKEILDDILDDLIKEGEDELDISCHVNKNNIIMIKFCKQYGIKYTIDDD